MSGFIRKFHKALYRIKVREHLDRIPRMYANDFDRTKVNFDDARVFARIGARSPDGVRLIMKRWRIKDFDELIRRLPHRNYRPRPAERLRRLLQHVLGLTDHEPVVRPALRRLAAEGRSFEKPNTTITDRLNRALGDDAP